MSSVEIAVIPTLTVLVVVGAVTAKHFQNRSALEIHRVDPSAWEAVLTTPSKAQPAVRTDSPVHRVPASTPVESVAATLTPPPSARGEATRPSSAGHKITVIATKVQRLSAIVIVFAWVLGIVGALSLAVAVVAGVSLASGGQSDLLIILASSVSSLPPASSRRRSWPS